MPPTKKKMTEKNQSVTLDLTPAELKHIRDLFSVYLPEEEELTVSSALAQMKEDVDLEVALWKKIVDLCQKTGISVGDDAPDFLIGGSINLYQVKGEE